MTSHNLQPSTPHEAQPTSDYHLQRLHGLDNLLVDVAVVRASLDWLAAHDPIALEEARLILHSIIKDHLAELTVLEQKWKHSDPTDDLDHALTLLHQLEPLADYFPVIHLSYGLVLIHRAKQQFRKRDKSPLDILDEILAAAEHENDTEEKQPKRSATDQTGFDLYEESCVHLKQAAQLFPKADSRRGAALEALGDVCEKLADDIGAWQAYRDANTYEHKFTQKLEELGKSIRKWARQRVLSRIDSLLAANDLDAAEVLLALTTPQHAAESADFRVRSADLAFLKGDLETAAAIYKEILEGKQ